MTLPDDPSARQRLARLSAFLEQDPGNTLLRQELFDAAIECGAFGIAQSQLEQALLLQPDAPRWRHNLALLQLAQHDYAGAEGSLRRLLELGETAGAIPYNLAWSLFFQERYSEALVILQPLLDERDAPPVSLSLYLRCLHRTGQIDVGIEAFRVREAGHQAGADAYGCASLMALDGEHFDLAGNWAQRALDGDPFQLEALVTRASLALGRHDAATALQDLQRALEIQPRDGRTWSAMGMAHMLTGQLEVARSDFHQAVHFMPDHIGTWHGLGWCEILLKDLDAAVEAFRRALDIDRNFGDNHGALAVVRALQGQADAAQPHLERALRLDPASLSARYAQTILSGEAQQQDAIKRLAERLLKNRTGVDGRPLVETVLRSGLTGNT